MFIDEWEGESQARRELLCESSEAMARASLSMAQRWLARLAQADLSALIIDFDPSGERIGPKKEGQPENWKELMEAFKQEDAKCKESSRMEIWVVARIGALRLEGRLKAVRSQGMARAGLWALGSWVSQEEWIAGQEAKVLKEQSQSAAEAVRAEGKRL